MTYNFIMAYAGMTIANIAAFYFMKKSAKEIFDAQYWGTFGFGLAVGVWALS